MPTTPYSANDHALYLTDYESNTIVGQGEADADFISAEFVNDTVNSIEGAKGDVQDSIRVAEMGRITFTNQWGSSFNKSMNKIYADQQDGKYLQKAEIKRISDEENTTVVTSSNPKVVKLPNYTIGVNASDRAYIFNVHHMEFPERAPD